MAQQRNPFMPNQMSTQAGAMGENAQQPEGQVARKRPGGSSVPGQGAPIGTSVPPPAQTFSPLPNPDPQTLATSMQQPPEQYGQGQQGQPGSGGIEDILMRIKQMQGGL